MNESSDHPISARTPAEAAQATVRSYAVTSAAVVSYVSRGYLLVLGKTKHIELILHDLSPELTTYVVLTDACPPALLQKFEDRGIAVLDLAADLEIKGYLGAFRISGSTQDRPERIDRCFDVPEPGFDLVLDLLEPSIARQVIPPVGYFAVGGTPRKWKKAVAQLPDWIGEFDKPKYFDYTKAICAHSAKGIEGCRLCIDICDPEAIHSDNLQLRINPNLCQGCGDCTTVCPSGAISYAYPQRSDSLNRTRLMLAAYAAAGGKVPVLLLHDAHSSKYWLGAHAPSLPINVLPYELESLSAAGIDVWLAALAYGAEQVLLLDSGQLSENNRRCLHAQLEYAGEILNGMGYSGARIRIVKKDDLLCQTVPVRSNTPARRPARFAGVNVKHTAIRLAVDYLLDYAPVRQDHVTLSHGAPFGALSVDPQRCTLCLSCVSICPEGALLGERDHPRLNIIEALCVQCGLCEQACPEDAIALLPRYLYDTQQAREPRLLNQDAAFHCIACGKPFATERVIKTLIEKLEDHPTFQGEAARRLQMCEDCRVKVLFDAPSPERDDNGQTS